MGRVRRRYGVGRLVISASARDLPRKLIHIGIFWPTTCPPQVGLDQHRHALEKAAAPALIKYYVLPLFFGYFFGTSHHHGVS